MHYHPMRRTDKELDNETTLKILNDSLYGTLALCDNEGAYAVPLNYVFFAGELFFHSASSGHKIECIKHCQNASFNIIGKTELSADFTTKYQSVTAKGEIKFIDSVEEKKEALLKLCQKYYDYDDITILNYIAKFIDKTTVFKMSCEFICGKGLPF